MSEKEKNYCIFVTGGHATPAVACINELLSRDYKNIVYVGQKKSILFDKNNSSEYHLIQKMGIPFVSLIAGKLSLFLDVNSLIWILRLPYGFLQALFVHFKYRPRLILTFGSHVGLPVVFWGWFFKTPIIAHEQTVTLGRANKIIQKFATKVCYSWQYIMDDGDLQKTEDNRSKVENTKFIYTGNPIRKEIFNVKSKNLNFTNKDKKIIFITGGNQGAHTLNEYFFNLMPAITAKYNVIHQTGSNTVYNDFDKAEGIAEDLNKKGLIYMPIPYIYVEQMAEAYNKCFVVIARAGANTVTELLALQKKAIMVPIPTTSGNEQFLNAEFLRKLGLAIVINQTDLNQMDIMKVLEEAESLKVKDKELVSLISSMHREAEKSIVDIIEKKLKKLII